MSGYAHPAYAAALAAFGEPRSLSASGGWLLTSAIAGTPWSDGRGCYPLFCAAAWPNLKVDLESLPDLVSAVLVADPFGGHDPALLRDCFPDLCLPWKEHFLVDVENPVIAPHHARNIRKAGVEVEHCPQPMAFADDWLRLYALLVERHHIQGIAAFSPESLRLQLQVPGLVMFRAVREGETVGMVLWYEQGEVGYYHLAAYTDVAYQHHASYALFDCAIRYFKGRLRWLNLGAGAGVSNDGSDGLTRFKRGWASGTRTAWLCGRILQPDVYHNLVSARQIEGAGFFPLYRKGEIR
jgi:hypothetical protein